MWQRPNSCRVLVTTAIWLTPQLMLQAPAPAPTPAPSALTNCFSAAGLAYVDGSNPTALAQASEVWNKMNTTLALAVVYPSTEDQVAAAVKCCRASGVQAVPR